MKMAQLRGCRQRGIVFKTGISDAEQHLGKIEGPVVVIEGVADADVLVDAVGGL